MRITGGQARGIPLKAPGGEGTRPATDRLREAVFSSLGPAVADARVADLFAGTGSYGWEALSRGARTVNFYESDRAALACLRQNSQAVLRSLNLDTSVIQIVPGDLFKRTTATHDFDLIFLDPPYASLTETLPEAYIQVIENLATPQARVILEAPGHYETDLPGWTLRRRLGKPGRDKPTAFIFDRDPES